jgi:hypothetical protein
MVDGDRWRGRCLGGTLDCRGLVAGYRGGAGVLDSADQLADALEMGARFREPAVRLEEGALDGAIGDGRAARRRCRGRRRDSRRQACRRDEMPIHRASRARPRRRPTGSSTWTDRQPLPGEYFPHSVKAAPLRVSSPHCGPRRRPIGTSKRFGTVPWISAVSVTSRNASWIVVTDGGTDVTMASWSPNTEIDGVALDSTGPPGHAYTYQSDAGLA